MKFAQFICYFISIVGSFYKIDGALFPLAPFETPSPYFIDSPEEIKNSVGGWMMRIEEGYSIGRWIGFEKNYGEIGLFFAPTALGNWQPFTDLRGFIIENGKCAGSVGLGMRIWNASQHRVLGANLYYDIQQASFDPFQRIGIGIESLGESWDFRMNSYIVIDGTIKKGKYHIYHFLGGFVESCQVKESSFRGADAEIGRNLWRRDEFSFYCALGPYYYRTKCHEIFGGYFRFQLNWMENLIFEGLISQDREFHTQVQGKFLISLPLYHTGSRGLSARTNKPRKLLTQRIQRNRMIATQKYCEYKQNW